MLVKKTTSVKTPIAKKSFSKTIHTNPKSDVVVETKKTNTTNKNFEKIMKNVILILIVLNLIFTLFNFFSKDSALKLEELKAGWAENLQKVMELYNSDTYKEQQTAAIQQFMMQWQ